MHSPSLLSMFCLCLALAGTVTCMAENTNQPAPPNAETPSPAAVRPDVPFIATPDAVVDQMLKMAEIKEGDVLYDLGCGDGRIVIAAAEKFGVRAVGVEIDPELVKRARQTVAEKKLGHLVTIKQEDIYEIDFQEATVMMIYLSRRINEDLMPDLAKLKPGSRIISHQFDMGNAKEVDLQTVRVDALKDDEQYGGHERLIYKWLVPWETTIKPPVDRRKKPAGWKQRNGRAD